MTFNELNLHPQLLQGIDAMGFKDATPIQEAAIPHIIDGRDIVGSAQTGTGKTAAFLLPILHKIIESGDKDNTKALIVAPTRELVKQIDQQIQGLSYYTDVNSIAVYGGGDGDLFAQEQTALKTGAPIVVATPGRLIAHLSMNYVKFDQVDTLILDEADRMLDMGFYQDIVKIISYLPKERQNLFFSATMPKKAEKLANEILHNPEVISFAVSKPAEKIIQLAFSTYDEQKIPLIKHILAKKDFKSVVIFCSTKDSAKKLYGSLNKLNYSVSDIHSDLDQKKREEILNLFKARKLNIIVATDIISRGIDIEDIDLVINYNVPNDGEDYIHRIGRTARAASSGVAITLINDKDQRNFAYIEKLLEKDVPKGTLPEDIGEGPVYSKEKWLKSDSKGPKRRSFKGKRN